MLFKASNNVILKRNADLKSSVIFREDSYVLGDICQQFTNEVFEMYRNYADYKCWNFEILNYTPADYGMRTTCQAKQIDDFKDSLFPFYQYVIYIVCF